MDRLENKDLRILLIYVSASPKRIYHPVGLHVLLMLTDLPIGMVGDAQYDSDVLSTGTHFCYVTECLVISFMNHRRT